MGPDEGWVMTPFGNIVGPQGLIRSEDFSKTTPSGLALSPLKPRHITGEWDGDGRRILEETIVQMLGETENMGDGDGEDEDEDDDDDDDGGEKKKGKSKKSDKRKKKRKKALRGASTKGNDVAAATEGSALNTPKGKNLTKQGTKILRQILGDEHQGPVSRNVVASISNQDKKVSRLRQAAADAEQKMTRKRQVEHLPPVRRGGGAIYVPSPAIAKRRPTKNNNMD